jgi:hypothetical protein
VRIASKPPEPARRAHAKSAPAAKQKAVIKKKNKKKRKSTPFFAVPSAGLVGWWVGRAASGFTGVALAIDAAGAGAGAAES